MAVSSTLYLGRQMVLLFRSPYLHQRIANQFAFRKLTHTQLTCTQLLMSRWRLFQNSCEERNAGCHKIKCILTIMGKIQTHRQPSVINHFVTQSSDQWYSLVLLTWIPSVPFPLSPIVFPFRQPFTDWRVAQSNKMIVTQLFQQYLVLDGELDRIRLRGRLWTISLLLYRYLLQTVVIFSELNGSNRSKKITQARSDWFGKLGNGWIVKISQEELA